VKPLATAIYAVQNSRCKLQPESRQTQPQSRFLNLRVARPI